VKLIKELGTRKREKSKRFERFGLFYCPLCCTEVERQKQAGIKAKSCGCKTFHGDRKTRLYTVWVNMRQRCTNSNLERYRRYGGRGITVCAEWMFFINFRKWALENGYKDDLTIDRRNNDKGYYSDNCRFISKAENNRNTSNVKLSKEKSIEIKDLYSTGDYTQRSLAKMYNVSQRLIFNIIKSIAWA